MRSASLPFALTLMFFSQFVASAPPPPSGAGGGGPPASQGGAGGPGSSGSPAANGPSGGFPGISWARAEWDSKLTVGPSKGDVLICYKLVVGNTAAQPYLLEPVRSLTNYHASPGCSALDSLHPIFMRQRLVIGIDVANVPIASLKLLNINVTNQQGVPINPNPIRPSFSPAAAGSENLAGPVVYFLIWPNQIPGDVLPTVSINTVYTPPVPGQAWQPQTVYLAGTVVTPTGQPSHFYVAITSGISDPPGNPPPFSTVQPGVVSEGTTSIVWNEMTAPPANTPGLQQWQPNTVVSVGGMVTPTVPTGHAYKATARGITGRVQPNFPITPGSSVLENSTLQWMDAGTNAPSVAGGGAPTLWLPSTLYVVGSVILVPANGHYYVAMSSGVSGASPPTFPVTISGQLITETSVDPKVEDSPSVARMQWQYYDSKSARVWTRNTAYNSGDYIVVRGLNGDQNDATYFVANNAGTSSSDRPSAFNISLENAEARANRTWTVRDNDIEWRYVGPQTWGAGQPYPTGFLIQPDPPNGNFYKALIGGTSGPTQPAFPLVTRNPITWQDVGTTPPPSVTAGVPSDMTVNLVNIQLPQSHSLYYFNVSSGVLYGSVRSENFSFQIPKGASNCGASTPATTLPPCNAVASTGAATVDPVVMFTGYFQPMDSESPYSFSRDFWRWPGFSFGLSLANPTSNFYLGFSSEFPTRNIQLVYGVMFSKVARLASPESQPPGTPGGTPNTVQTFKEGFFIGFTYNISQFLPANL